MTVSRGVVLAAGGFDHDMEMRHKFQSAALGENMSLGADTNTGDALRIGQDCGAAIDSMNQAWWFPAVAPLPGGAPKVMLAERSLPGSFIVDHTGNRFINEATDYMSFGQRVLERERSGDPAESMWIIFDQQYRNSYVFAGQLYPRMPLPVSWFEARIAYRADSLADLAAMIGIPRDAFLATVCRFNESAAAGDDGDFHRGRSSYDRYYGDPTVTPIESAPAAGRSMRCAWCSATWGPAVACVLTSAHGCCVKTAVSSRVCMRSAIPPPTRSVPPIRVPGQQLRRDSSTDTSRHMTRPRGDQSAVSCCVESFSASTRFSTSRQ